MPAILPACFIDSDKALTVGKFMRHQRAWILDESPMCLAEKSVRIGWTYADAYKNVRRCIMVPKTTYLFATKDQGSAVEFMKTCAEFGQIFGVAKGVLSHGEDYMSVPRLDKDGKDTGFIDQVKFCFILFDNGSRIIAFSSNPNAMLVYGGHVGLDEFAAHPQQDKLWETAQGRVTIGFQICVWSAHKGVDTLFYEFAREARAGRGGWSYYKVTMEDACDMGYLDMLYELNGKRLTKAEHLQNCRNRSRLDDIYEQAYNCNPRGGVAAAVPWSVIELCQRPYEAGEFQRAHLEADQIDPLFGKFMDGQRAKEAREKKIEQWMASEFGNGFGTGHGMSRYTLGFDVAASGEGDLASIYVDEKDGPALRLSKLLTMRTEDWHFMKTCARWFMKTLPDVTGCGDETGLGRQICWELAQEFEGRFFPVNFSSSKHDMGFAMINAMATGEKTWPDNEPDISQDFFALKKTFQGKRWVFGEGPNILNPNSHCDIAWAGALSSHAATQKTGFVAYQSIKTSVPGLFGGFEEDSESGLWLPN